jgi:cytochrome c
MTLGNMRANGVRSLDVSCWHCHHEAGLSADSWPAARWTVFREMPASQATGRRVAALR